MASKPSASRPRPKKSFSQNFLVNLNAARRIVDSLGLSPDDKVLEIGAGQGVLTEFLLEKSKKVYAVELDRRLVLFLREKLATRANLEIIQSDILKVKPEDYMSPREKIKVVGNLPYQITSPILDWLVQERKFIRLAVVTVQKEVARRMCGRPGTRDWSPLSIFCQLFFRPEVLFTLSAGSFYPAPKVNSAVVKLEILEEPAVEITDETAFFQLVRQIFSARRKTLLKTLSGGARLPRDRVWHLLNELGLRSDVRGETLTIEQVAKLSVGLSEIRNPAGFEIL